MKRNHLTIATPATLVLKVQVQVQASQHTPTESNEQYVVYEKKSSDDSTTGNSGTKGPGPGLTTHTIESSHYNVVDVKKASSGTTTENSNTMGPGPRH